MVYNNEWQHNTVYILQVVYKNTTVTVNSNCIMDSDYAYFFTPPEISKIKMIHVTCFCFFNSEICVISIKSIMYKCRLNNY